MIRKLLFRDQDIAQLVIAIIGAFLGMTFLLTSIHYLIKVNEFGEGADILGPNTIIVQKKVSTSNTLNIAKSDFTKRELENLRKEPFIIDVQPVETNNFDHKGRFTQEIFINIYSCKFISYKN
ncbi:MAG: hypothetical protein HYZ43_13290 [Flavobacteriia bacterium]|nr:hypothetical protein [Flavobacteriia bacterium]